MAPIPSTLLRALLPPRVAPSVSRIAARLEAAEVGLSPDVGLSCRWCLRGVVDRADGPPLEVSVSLRPSRGLPDHGGRVGAEEAESSDYELAIACDLGDRPLHDYHTLVRIAHAAAPDLALLCDDASGLSRFPAWVRETAALDAPPSPRALYAVHAVHRDGKAWVHTHGLGRAGALEVELLDIPTEAVDCLDPLIHAVAAQWLDDGPPRAGERCEAGRELELVWLPWSKAIATAPPTGAGGESDRDEAHTRPGGVLFVPERGFARTRWRCPSSLRAVLRDDPLLYVSQLETARMSALARARWGLFTKALARHRQTPGYRFLVKLGYEGQGPHADQREHLWAEVHESDPETLVATIACRPRLVPLQSGERGAHAVERVTDWLVVTPHGHVGPDDAIALDEDLD
jgi:hypothetical protein